jgi:RNA polymerase sigma factor (sigma-70 family)
LATTIVEAPPISTGPGAFAKLEDDRLVSAIGDGHDEAFEAFYDRYHDGVLSFCRHMLGSQEDAEDAVQQTFLATYKQAHAASPPAHPRAWLYTVARNRCLTTIRARRESSTDTIEPTSEGLDQEVERRQELRELLGDLGRLPEDQRVALLLFELGALDQTEIAETIGCAPKKVKALVYQARTTLAHRAEARNARCSEIREQLATLRGGTLNNRAIKHHLEICDGCSEFRDEVRRQRARFGLILPVIPLTTSHGAVLSALGLGGNGASHVAAAAANGGAVHAAAGGGRMARWAAYATRPRVAAIAALTAGTAGVAIITGGHDRHAVAPIVPPAQAAAPTAKAAAKTLAPTPHRTAVSQRHRQPAARGAAQHRKGAPGPAMLVHQPTGHSPVAPSPQSPTGTPPTSPVRNAPGGSNPPAGTPQGSPPSSSKPADPPGTTPPTSTGTPPPTPQPESSCGPNGQGGGHAWGHCKGPDGLPPPAEEHRQGQGDPGGPKH